LRDCCGPRGSGHRPALAGQESRMGKRPFEIMRRNRTAGQEGYGNLRAKAEKEGHEFPGSQVCCRDLWVWGSCCARMCSGGGGFGGSDRCRDVTAASIGHRASVCLAWLRTRPAMRLSQRPLIAKNAMNGAQLLRGRDDSSGDDRATCLVLESGLVVGMTSAVPPFRHKTPKGWGTPRVMVGLVGEKTRVGHPPQ
jgi:hypothetical protein